MQALPPTLHPHIVRSITRLGLLTTFSLLCIGTLVTILFITVKDATSVGPNMSYALNVITIYAAFLRTFQGSKKENYLLGGTPTNTPEPSPEPQPVYYQNAATNIHSV